MPSNDHLYLDNLFTKARKASGIKEKNTVAFVYDYQLFKWIRMAYKPLSLLIIIHICLSSRLSVFLYASFVFIRFGKRKFFIAVVVVPLRFLLRLFRRARAPSTPNIECGNERNINTKENYIEGIKNARAYAHPHTSIEAGR